MPGETNNVRPPIPLDDFDFDIENSQIAREPVRPRDASRMLVVDRSTGNWTDSRFRSLGDHLSPGDLLVINDARVVNARILGTLERTGRDVEVLFASPIDGNTWAAMLHPGRRIRSDDRIVVEAGGKNIYLKIGKQVDHGLREVTLGATSNLTVAEFLDKYGHMPLPPYIDRDDNASDRTDYQTVYARHEGAIAAPTAGLHFTDEVFAALEARGIETARLTLHVGIGTFLPVRTPNARDHHLVPERFEMPDRTAEALNRARAQGRRTIAVGTTTTRTLEYLMARDGRFVPGTGETDLYILPGHRFRAVDGLLTNFHLPRSTLLLLVVAFAGHNVVMEAYRHAIETGYRFYSFGDAALFV